MNLESISSLPYDTQIKIMISALEMISVDMYKASLMIQDTESNHASDFLSAREHDAAIIREKILSLFKMNMNRKYFINIRSICPINKLDEQLQKAFIDEFDNRLISYDQIGVFKDFFKKICDNYQSFGGRASMEFKDFEKLSSGSMLHAAIGKGERYSTTIILTATRGEVLRE